jgi:hypothetical protein
MIITNEMRRHEAIRNVYSEVVTIREAGGFNTEGAAIELDEALITAEITRLQAEYDANAYARSRATAYPSLADQADMQFHDAVDGTTTWQDAIQAVKDANPKP